MGRFTVGMNVLGLALSIFLTVGCSLKVEPLQSQDEDRTLAAAGELNLTTLATTNYNYTKDIAPIMSKHCVGCHNTGFKSGGYDFSVYDQGTNPAGTNLQRWTNALNSMYAPPKGGMKQMPYGCAPGVNCAAAADVAIMQSWVDGGIPQNPVVAATPVASPLAVTVIEGGSVPVVLSAKEDNYTGAFTYTVKSNPQRGTLSGTAPNLSYKANPSSAGSDSFTYTAKDASGQESLPATVAITINSATVPVAESFSVVALQNVATGVLLRATGPNPGALVYSVVKMPMNGSLSGTAPNLSYKSNATYVGNDSFTYVAADTVTGKSSNVATVTITVSAPVVYTPVASPLNISVNQNASAPVTLIATEQNYTGGFTYAIASSPKNGTLSGAAPALTYKPNQNYVGSDSFTYTAKDNVGKVSSPAMVSITVKAINPPVAQNVSVTATSGKTVPITLISSNPNGGGLTYSVLTSPAKGTLSGTAPNLNYAAMAGYVGNDSFTYMAKENGSGLSSNTATVSIKVQAPVNNSPTAGKMNVFARMRTPVSFVLKGSDPDGEVVSFKITSFPSKGNLSGVAPNLTYTPRTFAIGQDTFTYEVKDPSGAKAQGAVCIDIGMNQAPEAETQRFDNFMTNRDHQLMLLALDPNGQKLSYSMKMLPKYGKLLGTPPALIYRPNTDYVGSDAFAYMATDPNGLSSPLTMVYINVTAGPASNYAPVIQPKTFYTNRNRAVPVALEAIDPEMGQVTYAVVTPPLYGKVSGTAPYLTYTPSMNWAGVDTIKFSATDAGGKVSQGTFSISVNTSDVVPTYFPSVKSIIDAKCARCHQAGGVEFLQLTNYATVSGAAQLISNAVAAGHMPPGQPTADNSPMADNRLFLSSAEKEMLFLWVNGGAPEGNPADNLSSPPKLTQLPRVDVDVNTGVAYTPIAGDDYQWFELPWPLTTDAYITGYDVKPGPDVHHILLFASPAQGTTPAPTGAPSCQNQSSGGGGSSAATDLLKKMLSFTSFIPYIPTFMKQMQVGVNQGLNSGQSAGSTEEVTQGLTDLLIGGFVPGAGANVTAEPGKPSAGIFVPAGSKLKVQFHFNTTKNANGQPSGPDTTQFKFMVESQVDKPIYMALLVNPIWIINKDTMLIPKNAPATTVSALTNPFLFYPDFDGVEELEVLGGLFHMHYRGEVGALNAVDSKGKRTLLLKNPKYDYNFQNFYALKDPFILKKGMQIESVCTWNNTMAYSPVVAGTKVVPVDYYWGEKTGEEMCLPLLSVSPVKK